MTNTTLAQSYLLKATKRLKVLELLQREEAYSDVVREAQELVELGPGSPSGYAKSASLRFTETSTLFRPKNTPSTMRPEPFGTLPSWWKWPAG